MSIYQGYFLDKEDNEIIPNIREIVIEDNADLNDITLAGIYHCRNVAHAQTLSNCPVEGKFDMFVFNLSSYPTQFIVHQNGLYFRASSGSGWTAWNQTVDRGAAEMAVGSASVPVYINSNGTPAAITSYSGKAATAGTADKLGTNAGSSSLPVYFSNGMPVAVSSIVSPREIYAGTNSTTTVQYVGARSNANNAHVVAQSGSSTNAGLWHSENSGFGSNRWLIYINQAGTITSNASSDKRLKNEVGELTAEEAKAVLSGVRPINYVYKADDDPNNVQNGIYAQDLRDILIQGGFGYRTYLSIENAKKQSPEDDERDFFNDLEHDENEVTYGIDYSKLVPVLIKGWQIHEQKIKELENQIKELT